MWAFSPIAAQAQQLINIWVFLQNSTYIPSGGNTDTTAQLTAPSGKSTSDFQAGKISDDTNPLPVIDLDTNRYTEVEFCFLVVSGNSPNDEIEFRITDNSVLLDGYLFIPKIIIESLEGTPIPVFMRTYRNRRL